MDRDLTTASQPRRYRLLTVLLAAQLLCGAGLGLAAEPFTIDDAARTRVVTQVAISPDGESIAYVLGVPRTVYEGEDGAAFTELHVVGPGEDQERAFVTGEVNVSRVAWLPDGRALSFLAKRGDDEHPSLYTISVDGGEARKVLEYDEKILEFSWSPDGTQVAFLAKEAEGSDKEKLEELGFMAEVYEEGLRDVGIWIASIEKGTMSGDPRRLAVEGSASELHWSPTDQRIAVALAPTSRIDDHYMKRSVHILDSESGDALGMIVHPGKLGHIHWSPDGKTIGLTAAGDPNDPSAGRLMVAPATGGVPEDILPRPDGDTKAFAFVDNSTIVYVGHQGVEASLGQVGISGSDDHELVAAGGPILRSVSFSADGKKAAFVADSPEHPAEVFSMSLGEVAPTRRTDSNPWLAERRLAPQEVITYKARDGLEVQALLIRPLDEQSGTRYPLIIVVHGGPESHYSNGWVTRYSTPGQFAAAGGYAVLYPNYRGSTGRGVEFSKLDQADYARAEFNDLVDGMKHLVAKGLVDEEKVGVTGGSYGGFASAWCATALTEHFAASVMFVGISDQISKFGTTDIPNEMFMVHARRMPWDYWDWFRERSPIYYTPQAETPILILAGKDDTRVHPSQSMELYRYLKTLGKVPVRLVLYPGEGHGNRKAAARYDYSIRLMRWMDHYLKGPGGDPPPHELEHDPARLGEKEADDE